MNAEQWNERYPIGTPVVAHPGARPVDDPSGERLVTRTRSKAQVLGGHTDVVWVERHGACIALTHVDPLPDEGPQQTDAACGWNPVQATTDCDWDRNCPVHGDGGGS